MQQNQRIILYILILIAGASWTLLSANKTLSPTIEANVAPQAGFRAPDFTLISSNSKAYSLSNFRGQAILVNLWATWCPPCRAEMPVLEKMFMEYKNKGFTILAIDMTYQDDPLAVDPFAKKYGLTFPILFDQNGLAAAAYQLRSLPSSFFIKRDGTILEVVIGGPMSEALLRTRIEEILK
jgi:cytochrome c biogenesis protein CcmG/thiol:disulfide interchange protein DsbE